MCSATPSPRLAKTRSRWAREQWNQAAIRSGVRSGEAKLRSTKHYMAMNTPSEMLSTILLAATAGLVEGKQVRRVVRSVCGENVITMPNDSAIHWQDCDAFALRSAMFVAGAPTRTLGTVVA